MLLCFMQIPDWVEFGDNILSGLLDLIETEENACHVIDTAAASHLFVRFVQMNSKR